MSYTLYLRHNIFNIKRTAVLLYFSNHIIWTRFNIPLKLQSVSYFHAHDEEIGSSWIFLKIVSRKMTL